MLLVSAQNPSAVPFISGKLEQIGPVQPKPSPTYDIEKENFSGILGPSGLYLAIAQLLDATNSTS